MPYGCNGMPQDMENLMTMTDDVADRHPRTKIADRPGQGGPHAPRQRFGNAWNPEIWDSKDQITDLKISRFILWEQL